MIYNIFFLGRKDMDVHEHERLSNFIRIHQLKELNFY